MSYPPRTLNRFPILETFSPSPDSLLYPWADGDLYNPTYTGAGGEEPTSVDLQGTEFIQPQSRKGKDHHPFPLIWPTLLGILGLPSGLDGKESGCNAENWVRSLGWEDIWRREWLPTLVFLPREFHGQRSLMGYSPWGSQRVGHEWVTNTFSQYTYSCLIILRPPWSPRGNYQVATRWWEGSGKRSQLAEAQLQGWHPDHWHRPPPLVAPTAPLASLGPLLQDAGGLPGIHPPVSHPDFPLGNLPLCSFPPGALGEGAEWSVSLSFPNHSWVQWENMSSGTMVRGGGWSPETHPTARREEGLCCWLEGSEAMGRSWG